MRKQITAVGENLRKVTLRVRPKADTVAAW